MQIHGKKLTTREYIYRFYLLYAKNIAESKSLIVFLKSLFLSCHAQSVRLKWL